MSTVRVAVCSEFGQVVHLMSPNNAEPKPDIVLLIDHRATNPPCQTKVICWTRAHMNLVEDTLPIYADDPRVHLILDNVWPEYVSGTYLLTYALHGES